MINNSIRNSSAVWAALLLAGSLVTACGGGGPDQCEGLADACDLAGARRCDNSAGVIQECRGNADGCLSWTQFLVCNSQQVCDASSGEPVCICEHACPQTGDTRCEMNAIQTCGLDADECRIWLIGTDCSQTGQVCSMTNGVASCEGECVHQCSTIDATRCAGTVIETCTTDLSGCRGWSAGVDCQTNGDACDDSSGAAECVTAGCLSECDAIADKRCHSVGEFVVCQEVEPGCLQWSEPEACPGSLTCNSGECEANCVSECAAADVIGCWDSTSQQVCQEVEPGCLKWSQPEDCLEHQVCNAGGGGCACQDGCTQGVVECVAGADPAQVRGCTPDTEGCLYWSIMPCGETDTCVDGECIPACVSDPDCTTVGLTSCVDAGSQSTCEESEPGCLTWSQPTACPEHQECLGDSCSCIAYAGCDNAGDRRCLDLGHESVCQEDPLGCLYWNDVECPVDQVCNSGTCSTVCQSDPGCDVVGASQCTAEGALQICVEFEPGCLKWDTPSDCPLNQVCSDGQGCVCEDSCSVGLSVCDQDGMLNECLEDLDGCAYLAIDSCSNGETCVVDGCLVVESPQESCGTVIFNLVDRGYTQVLLAGSFNPSWDIADSVPMQLQDGVWSVEYAFGFAGDYEYKFVIDGLYYLDALNPETVGEGFFTNSVVHVALIQDCDVLADTRCAGDGSLQECILSGACLSWQAAAEACVDADKYCEAGVCQTFTSPVVDETEVTFTVRDEGYSGLSVLGDFTEPVWEVPLAMQQLPGRFSLTLQRADHPGLTAGDHSYKYRTDAEVWFFDPVNPNLEPDGEGGFNSILTITLSCTSECVGTEPDECLDQTNVRQCQLAGDGCYYLVDSGCNSDPAQYCLLDTCQSFPMVDAVGQTVTFYYPDNGETAVDVAGDFTDPVWQDGSLPMTLSNGLWSVTTAGPLAPGSYLYKFILNKDTSPNWIPDPVNPNCDPADNDNCTFVIP